MIVSLSNSHTLCRRFHLIREKGKSSSCIYYQYTLHIGNMASFITVICYFLLFVFGKVANSVQHGEQIDGHKYDLKIRHLETEIERLKLGLQIIKIERDTQSQQCNEQLVRQREIIAQLEQTVSVKERKVDQRLSLVDIQTMKINHKLKQQELDINSIEDRIGKHGEMISGQQLVMTNHSSTISELEVISHALIPKGNIARLDKGARVINITPKEQGEVGTVEACINGIARLGGRKEFTVVQPGYPLVVKLGQVYILSSMKILFPENGQYKYYVEVSANGDSWTPVHDATREWHSGWQKVTFPPQLVQFIKIVPTAVPEPPSYWCDIHHIEAPAQE